MNAYETETMITSLASFEDFKERVKESLLLHFEEDVEITYQEVRKPGLSLMTGLTLRRKGYNTCPTVYLETYYDALRRGERYSCIIQNLIEIFDRYAPMQIELDFLMEYSNVKEGILYRLISVKGNEEFLKETPHKKYLNLALIFYYEVPEEILEGGRIIIKDTMLKKWKVSTEELAVRAFENWQKKKCPTLQDMFGVIRDIIREKLEHAGNSYEDVLALLENMGIKIDKEDIDGPDWKDKLYERIMKEKCRENLGGQMNVLGEKKSMFGANYLYDIKELTRVKERFGENYYILPSSVHELILIPESYVTVPTDELKNMVAEINRTTVGEEDVLSDSVYFFDGNTGKVSIL